MTRVVNQDEAPFGVLARYGLADSAVQSFGTGLINQTYLVTVGGTPMFVLQRLNKLFSPEVNRDIDALTRHLACKGAITPRLIPADNGNLWVEDAGFAWRLATYVPGICYNMLETDAQAHAAGELLGCFHRDVRDLHMELHGQRLGVHDTQRHLQNLRTSLAEHKGHRHFEAINELAREVLADADRLPELPRLPDRLVHATRKYPTSCSTRIPVAGYV